MDQIITAVKALEVVWILLMMFIAMLTVGSRSDERVDRFSRYPLMLSVGFVLPVLKFVMSDDQAAVGRYTLGFPFLNIVGLLCVAIGLGLNVLGIYTLGKQWSPTVRINRDHVLVQTGLYRYVRHPIYTAVLLELFGFCLAVGNWLSFLGILAPNLVTFGYRMIVEERALIRALGDQYRAYMKRTKRFIPKII